METYYNTTRHARRSQAIPDLTKWETIASIFHCRSMSTLPYAISMLLLSAALMLTQTEQAIVCGGVLMGSCLGAIGKVCHTLLAKSEAETPRQIILIRFSFHAGVGTILGVLGMIGMLKWFDVQYVLMTSIACGGVAAWMGHKLVKQLEPAIIRVLQDRGVIPRNLPDDATYNQARENPPTTKIIR